MLLAALWIALGTPHASALVTPQKAPQKEAQPLHWSGKDTYWDRRNGVVELIGDARVSRGNEVLEADYILLDQLNRTVDAKGNCEYKSSETVISSEEIHFNLDTGVGSIIGGRVTNGRYLLVGERINKLGPDRFQSFKAEYTTCQDCPGSWALQAEDVMMQVEGYAFMSNVLAKVKETPVAWVPYVILPVKSQRQTGLLFPKIGNNSTDGFQAVLPFFWAINRSTDMTLGLGGYTERGLRLEWEGRYALKGGSATMNFYRQQDTGTLGVIAPTPVRWGASLEQNHNLPFRIHEKLRILEVSDNRYPVDFEDDLEGWSGEPALPSELIFNHSSPYVSSYLSGHRYRNLLYTTRDNPARFDNRTVQVLPRAKVATNEVFLFGSPVAAGLTLGVDNFVRKNNPFDYDIGRLTDLNTPGSLYQAGFDPIREATRLHYKPALFTTIKPFGLFNVIPSVAYHGYLYEFPKEPDYALRPTEDFSRLNRGYLHFQTELNFQLEKIYDLDSKDYPKMKHLVRPSFKYSRIPLVHTSSENHPFLRQVARRESYRFDNFDTVPLGTTPSFRTYFEPLGHSVSYGVITQLIRRKGDKVGSFSLYERNVELAMGQTLDIQEYTSPEDEVNRIPLSRFYSTMEFDFEMFNARTEYFFYPYMTQILSKLTADNQSEEERVTRNSPHVVNSSFSIILDRELRHQLYAFERSFGLSYAWQRVDRFLDHTNKLGFNLTWSINDYIMPNFSISYDFRKHEVSTVSTLWTIRSPSRCWGFTVGFDRNSNKENSVSFEMLLNLTGDSFGNLEEIAGQAAPPSS